MKKYGMISGVLVLLFLFSFNEAFARIAVVSVQGTAAYKEGRKWTPLKAAMTLPEGCTISTGVKSTVVLKLNANTMTVGPLSMTKIYENRIDKDTSSTRVGLRRGTVRAQVTKGERVKTVFRIATPVATSSVRGTIKDVMTGPYGTTFSAPQGSFEVEPGNGQSGTVTGDLSYNQEGNDPESGSLVDDPTVQVYDPNISGDEKEGMGLFGGDAPDGPDGSVNTFDSLGPAKINVNIDWPGN